MKRDSPAEYVTDQLRLVVEIDNRVYPVVQPANTPFPAIVFSPAGADAEQAFEGEQQTLESFRISIRSESYLGLFTIADAAEKMLNTGGRLADLINPSEDYDTKLKAFRLGFTARIHI